MRIIISPAKKMNMDTDSFLFESLPQFLPDTVEILHHLQQMSYQELKSLWTCSDSLAQLNYDRLQHMDLKRMLTPAILSYEGIQYQYMAPGIFEKQQLEFISEHLRIVSGFYGLLRPFDGVVPYRLEMQAKLAVNTSANLYDFWGSKLATQLQRETDFIVNLASKEYSKSVVTYLSKEVHFLTCAFGELKNNKLIEKGTQCKMARGEMVRFMAEFQITSPESIKQFDRLGYQFSEEHSNQNQFVFIKGGSHYA